MVVRVADHATPLAATWAAMAASVAAGGATVVMQCGDSLDRVVRELAYDGEEIAGVYHGRDADERPWRIEPRGVPVPTALGDHIGGRPYLGQCPCGRQHMSTHAIVWVLGHIAYCSERCAVK